MQEKTMGRPYKFGYHLDKMLSVRVSEAEYKVIKDMANRDDVTVGTWVRQTLRREMQNG